MLRVPAVVLLLTLPAACYAQKTKSPSPQLDPLAVTGMQPGSRLELSLTGTNLADPTGLLLPPGFKATFTNQDNAKLTAVIEASADAAVGPLPLHLATTRGLSNLRVFCIDDLPPVAAGKVHDKSTPQQVPNACVVQGKVDTEKSDWYRISVSAGQGVSFDLLARRIGSNLDPQLSVYHPKTGRELAHDDDAPGCQGDARLRYTFKEAGDYLVEVRDVLYRGGGDFFYRLRIGDFRLANVPIPMAARRGSKVQVHFAGPHVTGVSPVDVSVPDDRGRAALWVVPKGTQQGWPVILLALDLDEQLETEPNNDAAKAQPLSIPTGVTGRFQVSDDTDIYRFTARKGQKLLVNVQTLEVNSPSLVYLVLKNAKSGAELAKSNPQASPPADQRIDLNAAEDGDFLIEVQHLNYVGGPAEAYHLTLTTQLPDLDVSAKADRFVVAAGGQVMVAIERKGYDGPLELEVVGNPGLTGKVTFKAGQKEGFVPLEAKGDLAPGPYVFAILAKASVDGEELRELVSVKGPISQQLAGLTWPPYPWQFELAVAVTGKK